MLYSWKTVLVTISLLVGLKIWSPYIVENIQWSWFDYLHQQQEKVKSDEILLVDIDERSLEEFGQYPFKRGIYSDILLNTHYSNTHVFTQLFSKPDRDAEEDLKFAEGLINRLTILSAAPSAQIQKGSAPFVNTSVFGGGDIKNHAWNFTGIVPPLKILSETHMV